MEKTLESSLNCKEIKPVNPKGNKSWIFIRRTDTEAEAPILWPPDMNSWLKGNESDAGKDWEQEKKGATEDEIVGWHHWLSGHEFEKTLGDGEGQGSLVSQSPWGCKEFDTEWLNNNNRRKWLFCYVLKYIFKLYTKAILNIPWFEWKYLIKMSHNNWGNRIYRLAA